MKYFLDTEFLEGTQKKWFGQTKLTIDLISIGIVAEDSREYYAISKDFNLKEAWNRYDLVRDGFKDFELTPNYKKVYWIRENVLKPIFIELRAKEVEEYNIAQRRNVVLDFPTYSFCFREFKRLINKYGKTNKQIAEEIVQFIDARWVEEGNISKGFMYPGGTSIKEVKTSNVQFYGYYCDYDWVVFCWLFGRMIDLPKGFPMYCIDLKQLLDDKVSNMEFRKQKSGDVNDYEIVKGSTNLQQFLDLVKGEGLVNGTYPKQTNEHNALADARWNRQLYNFLNTL